MTVPGRRYLRAGELGVLRGMARGLSNAEIAGELELSENTVKVYARSLFRILGARDRAHAVALGFRGELLSPGDLGGAVVEEPWDPVAVRRDLATVRVLAECDVSEVDEAAAEAALDRLLDVRVPALVEVCERQAAECARLRAEHGRVVADGLRAAADELEALGCGDQDYEFVPGWGDAVKRLRARADAPPVRESVSDGGGRSGIGPV